MKIQYREFEGPVMIVMGEGVGGEENRGQKNQTDFSIFWSDFHN